MAQKMNNTEGAQRSEAKKKTNVSALPNPHLKSLFSKWKGKQGEFGPCTNLNAVSTRGTDFWYLIMFLWQTFLGQRTNKKSEDRKPLILKKKGIKCQYFWRIPLNVHPDRAPFN